MTNCNVELALADRKLGWAGNIVEGVWRHRVVVRVIGCIDIEQHAVGLAIAKALTFVVSFTKSLAGAEGILGAAGLEVISWCSLDVCDNTATWRTGW